MRERGRERILHGTPRVRGACPRRDCAGRDVGGPGGPCDRNAGGGGRGPGGSARTRGGRARRPDRGARTSSRPGSSSSQRALLDDETLVDPIRAAARGGAAAHSAWTTALDREAAEVPGGGRPRIRGTERGSRRPPGPGPRRPRYGGRGKPDAAPGRALGRPGPHPVEVPLSRPDGAPRRRAR